MDGTVRVWDAYGAVDPTVKSPWTLSHEDGWIRSETGELIKWVPRKRRKTLLADQNLAMFGPNVKFTTEIGFSGVALGAEWTSGLNLVRRKPPPSTVGARKRKMVVKDGDSVVGLYASTKRTKTECNCAGASSSLLRPSTCTVHRPAIQSEGDF